MKIIIILTSVILLFCVTIYSIFVGSADFTIAEVVDLLLGNTGDELRDQIILNVRVPRNINAILVGMNLGVAGALLQGVLRNYMASPNVIGVNAGAGLAAVIIMAIFPGFSTALPLAAFSGALGATLLIYLLSNLTSKNSTVHIVLAGIAVSNLLSAFTSGIMTVYSDTLGITFSWMQGSLLGRSWPHVHIILPYSIVGLCLALFVAPKVNLFGLGDEMASSVGLSIKRYRMIIMVIASVLAGSAVSVAGTIGFVGLIAPHSARMLVGNDHRYLIPLSALFGGILLVVSDTIARTMFSPIEISVGIITAILGAPFFLLLLFRSRKK